MFKLRRQQQNAVRQASFGGLSISSKTSEELILEGANDAPQSNYCGYAVRIFYVIAYFAVGVVVYTQVEERECDDQPDVKTFTGVNVTIGDYFCENCIVMEDVETCYTPWTVVDTLYWSTVTVTTVGYGDYSPTTDAGRIFGFFYIIFGLGVVLGVIQSFVNNAIDRVEQNAKQRGRGGIDASELDETPQEITAQLYRKVAVSIGIIIAVSLLGGVIYSALEDWTYLDGVWWAFITSLTIGYGDQNLTSESSRIFSIFFVMGMVTLMTVLMGNLSGASYRLKVERKRAMLLETSLTPEVIDALDRDGDGVDRFEFVFGMLKLLDIVTEQVTLTLTLILTLTLNPYPIP
uniref:Potassium channel domain-containing protein n=1 Tax=Phaeomonas parva TaxID=124430 RepID=A0A7S1U1M1_9STRA|mmetsp:Transcript_26876/g.84224  ORF Transcript_26876/g.84224 Transcript_26876/m.84224 type:complete len:348 (+) Transcript_26876:502-1545(+)